MIDLELDKTYRRGSTGPKVTLIQEWLCLNDFNAVIDGDFGPATKRAVKRFQEARGLDVDGEVGPLTFGELVAPMKAALKPIARNGLSLGQMTAAYATQHVRQHPREVGGQNRGPWVRLYMKGMQGLESPWCAGFACYILNQACETVGVPLPLAVSFSSSALAASAKQKGIFLKGSPADVSPKVLPGNLFLVRGGPTGWKHTGIVIEPLADVFNSIEGNTNDEGSNEGYEACQRVRNYADKDFILI